MDKSIADICSNSSDLDSSEDHTKVSPKCLNNSVPLYHGLFAVDANMSIYIFCRCCFS